MQQELEQYQALVQRQDQVLQTYAGTPHPLQKGTRSRSAPQMLAGPKTSPALRVVKASASNFVVCVSDVGTSDTSERRMNIVISRGSNAQAALPRAWHTKRRATSLAARECTLSELEDLHAQLTAEFSETVVPPLIARRADGAPLHSKQRQRCISLSQQH